MTIGTYDTRTLLSVVQTLRPPSTFWQDNFFKLEQTFDTKYVDFDVVDHARRLAPYVAPTAQGKPMLQEGYETRRFTPAYIKPKDVIDPTRVMTRRPGEPYTGTLSPLARRDAVLVDIMQAHRDAIGRRWEFMAAQSALTGSCTVAGDDYPTVVISFGRAAGQNVVLTGTRLWTNAASTPNADIEAWAQQTQQLSGYAPTMVVMGLTAFAAYYASPGIQAMLNRFSGLSKIELNGATGEPWQFRGNDNGGRAIWTYNDIYEDENGVAQPYMDQTTVYLASDKVEGVRAFGAILDAKAGYQAVPIFPKTWIQEDPSAEFIMLQSSPLMIPRRPNAGLQAKVV